MGRHRSQRFQAWSAFIEGRIMMIQRILAVILLALPLASRAAGPDATRSEWVYLQSGPGVRISIETGHARKGWTPVTVSLAGAVVSFQMDGTGHVYPDSGVGAAARTRSLFIIDIGQGIIRLGDRSYGIKVLEQSAVRTRFMLADKAIELPVELDGQGTGGTLHFGRLEILVRIGTDGPVAADPTARPTGFPEPRLAGKAKGATAVLSVNRIKSYGK
jgi:hypothetical protein